MKTLTKTLIALALLAGIIFTGAGIAQAAAIAEKPALSTWASLCLSQGGTWAGPDGFEGTCTYPPGSLGHQSIGQCTETQNTVQAIVQVFVFVPGKAEIRFSRSVPKPSAGDPPIITITCEDISEGGPGYGKCGGEAGKTDEAVTINTCHGTSVSFAAGACTGKCTVGPKVLNTAKKGLSQLDGEVLGEAYVKVRHPDGGSYKICMSGEGTIYKWVSGEWRALPTQTVDGVSCAWSSGDGNYVLVAP